MVSKLSDLCVAKIQCCKKKRNIYYIAACADAPKYNKYCNETSTVVFYRTRVYQMQPRNGQDWRSSVGKYVHLNRETAKIGFCTSLKSISISGFVDT